MKNEAKINHCNNLPKLNRIAGQVEGIKKMMENERDCLDIVYQIRAVRSALKNIEKNILHNHIQHCVVSSFNSPKKEIPKKIEELILLFDKTDY